MEKPRREMSILELHDADDIHDIYGWLTEDIWENFWSKVDIRGEDECWPFQKTSRNQYDYGIFSYGGRSGKAVIAAHKLAYIFGEQHTWEPPICGGEVIMHTCKSDSSERNHDLRCCCNPRHLKRGTQSENIHDMIDAKVFKPFGQRMLAAQAGGGKVVCKKDE